jgi:hypothetical protein
MWSKGKSLNLLLIATSLLGYLEWGGNNNSFLFAAELEIFHKLLDAPASNLHPFIILPLLGQIILLITLFQKMPNKKLTYLGIACLGLLLLFILVIGILSLNIKIIISTIPFVVTAVVAIRCLSSAKGLNN